MGFVLVLAIARDAGFVSLSLPQNGRQVPQKIVDDGPRYGAFQFGFEMGTGVRTFVPTSLPYVLAIGLMLLADGAHALVAGIGFGVGRALMTLSRHAYPQQDLWDSMLRDRARVVAVLTTASSVVALAAVLAARLS